MSDTPILGMIANFWLRFLWPVRLWIVVLATLSSPSSVLGYDSHGQTTVAYDNNINFGTNHGFGYDVASALTIIEREREAASGQVHFSKIAEFLAAETSTALSPYRMTTAGETFSHYGYAEQAANFQGGLRPGGFATSVGDLTGAEAQSGLALPRPTAPPNAVYTVTPQPGTWVRANPVAAPQFGQPGGLPEFQFPGGTGPGTVSPPTPILPR